jgi:hypothetical protein
MKYFSKNSYIVGGIITLLSISLAACNSKETIVIYKQEKSFCHQQLDRFRTLLSSTAMTMTEESEFHDLGLSLGYFVVRPKKTSSVYAGISRPTEYEMEKNEYFSFNSACKH